MDGNRVPPVDQEPAVLDGIAPYTPILLCDVREPFRVIAAGYTVFNAPGPSDSFPRSVDWAEAGYPATRAIEYALWWDWDIQHLYELEHVWSFIDEAGNLVAAEASWHGYNIPIGAGESLRREGNHPVVYVQPGKHAMVSSAHGFDVMRDDAIQAAGEKAGADALLEHPLFRGQFGKTPEVDRLVKSYLRERAFRPSFDFRLRLDIRPAQLIPWPVLKAWIPLRVRWWVELLKKRA